MHTGISVYTQMVSSMCQCLSHFTKSGFDTCCGSSGFETEGLATAVWPGGETEALLRLERHLERKVRRNYYTVYAQNKNIDFVLFF